MCGGICNILNFPSELAFYILSMLSPQDLLSLRHTSRLYDMVVDHPSLWRFILLKNTSRPARPWRQSNLRRYIGRNVEVIEHLIIHNVRDDSLRYIINHCASLKTLHVYGWTTLSGHALNGRPLPNLDTLTLKCSGLAALDASAIIALLKQAPALKELNVLCPTAVRSQSLATNLSISTQLVKLRIYSTSRWHEDDLRKIFKRCTNLQQCNLMYYEANNMPSAQWDIHIYCIIDNVNMYKNLFVGM
jgi:hypothetical protein